MYVGLIESKLKVKLSKIYKKDKVMYNAIIKKIEEILKQPQHYKPLRYDLKNIRRVHIKKSFVLIFYVDENERTVKFLDLDHHDIIYKRKK